MRFISKLPTVFKPWILTSWPGHQSVHRCLFFLRNAFHRNCSSAPICLDTISDMVELSCKTQVPKVVMGGTSEILKVHKMSFGVGHGIPYTIRVWYILPLEMVREICHTWRLGRYPDPLFCKEYDIWCETLWFYWMCIVHLRHDSDEVLNPSPKKARWPSTKMDLRTEQIFLLFFFGVVPSLGRWNLMQHFELVIQFESNSWGVIEDFNRFKPSQLKKSPFKMARCWWLLVYLLGFLNGTGVFFLPFFGDRWATIPLGVWVYEKI